jgi:hypothetical protein
MSLGPGRISTFWPCKTEPGSSFVTHAASHKLHVGAPTPDTRKVSGLSAISLTCGMKKKLTNLAAAGGANFLLSLDCRQRDTKPRLIAKY